jgi:DNA-binding transcriptional ArsR family regulator
MDDTEMEGPQEPGELDDALLKAISHPLRHRLLGMLDGRVASPNELARELGLPLGRVSYHIRLLHELGAIELVRAEPRRGALEHFYRAVTRAWFGEGDWARLPRSARRGILGHNLQQIFATMSAAADAGGFDLPQSRLLRESLELDAEGLEAIAALATETLEQAREIAAASARRRGSAARAGTPTELSILHYARPT